ncbi:MAG: hypothetical protein MUC69_04770 [Gemmatimonadales bacterium]|nr:hypothetical protein [Gemmatimonadales bacterium]
MGAEVQQHVDPFVLAQPAIERREGVRRREAALEEEAHRVALVAHRGLHRHQHVPEARPEHQQPAAIRLLPPRRRPPLRLELGEVRVAAHVIVDRQPGHHVRGRPELLGVAARDALPQRVDAVGHLHLVARGRHRAQQVEQRLEDAQVRRRAGVAGVGREVEQHDPDAPLGARRAAQRHQACHAARQALGAVGDGRVPRRRAARALASAEHHRGGGTVEFRDRHHQRRLDRREATRVVGPVGHGLELEARRREVRHVELRQRLARALRVVEGGTAHQREAGERHQRVDGGAPVGVGEVALDGGAGVEAGREGRDHRESPGLERADHRVVVGPIAAQQVGAHQHHAHAAGGATGRQGIEPLGQPAPRQVGVVEAGLGVRGGRFRLHHAGGEVLRVPVQQHAHQVHQVLVRAGQPVLQREVVAAHVLRRPRDEAQQLRDAAQLPHLRLAAPLAGLAAAQPPQDAHGRPGPRRRRARPAHLEAPQARAAHHFGRRHDAHHRARGIAPRLERGEDCRDLLLGEEVRRDHDVGAGDVGACLRHRGGILRPGRGDVQLERQPRHLAREPLPRRREGGGAMRVERQQDDARGGVVSDRSAPWHRTTCRG